MPKGQRISEETNLFDEIFDHFEQQMEETEKRKHEQNMLPFSHFQPDQKRRRKQKKEESSKVEMALAISIILANLSCDLEFIKSLLGAGKWAEDQPLNEQAGDHKVINGLGKQINSRPLFKADYNLENVSEIPEVLRIK